MTRASAMARVVLASVSAVAVLLVLPSVALADNCSSLGDCWSTAAGAASAAFGAAVGAIGGLFGGGSGASGGGDGDGAGKDKDASSPSSKEPKPFDPPWWWPGYQLFSGLAPDPSPPGFDPLNPDLGPPAVEGAMTYAQQLKAKQALNRGDTDEYYRIKNMSRENYMKEFGKD